jgi:MFS family permease
MLGFASAVGLLLGGVLTDANLFGWSWRSVFFVNVPVAACALIAGLRFVPETKDLGARRPDLPGAALLAGSLVAIVDPLLEGRQLGWPVWVWLLLVAGLVLLVIPLVNVVLAAVPVGVAGGASGLFSTAQQLGGALGVALLGTVFFGYLSGHSFQAAIIHTAPYAMGAFGLCAVLSLLLPRTAVAEEALTAS